MTTNIWDFKFLDLAKLTAAHSNDPSTKTGAVIVRPDRTVCAAGYNHFPWGMEETPELMANREEKYSRIVHCEINALIDTRESLAGYTLYTWPFLSCERCCVQMLQAGITTFVAPKATAEQEARWGAAFEKTRRYINEVGGTIKEIDYEQTS